MNLFNPDKTYEEIWKEAYELRQKNDRISLANSLAIKKDLEGHTLWKKVAMLDDNGSEIFYTTTSGAKPIVFYYKGDSDDDLKNIKNWYVKESQKSSSGRGVDVMLSLELSSIKDSSGKSLPELIWHKSGLEIDVSPKNLPILLKLGYGVIISKSSQLPGSFNPLFTGNVATLHNSAIIYGGIIDDKVSFYKESVSFDRVIVGKEAMIGAGVRLAKGTILEDGATVRVESRLANDTYVGKEGILGAGTYTAPGMKIPFFAEVGRGKNTPTFSTYFWDGVHGFSDYAFSWKVKK